MSRRARRSIRRSRCAFCFPRMACRKRSCAPAIPINTRSNRPLPRCLAAWRRNDLDWKICYQSRATPQQWITPGTDAEITQAGRDKTAVLVVPIAFVSEHSETLVELDVDYNELAHRCGVPGYFRVPTQQLEPGFIRSLANLVRFARDQGVGLHAACDIAACASRNRRCPFAMRRPTASTQQRAV